MPYISNIHHRKSIKLKGYDYEQSGLYFITLCVQNRIHIFGDIVNKNLLLNQYGKIAKEEWLNTREIRENIQLH